MALLLSAAGLQMESCRCRGGADRAILSVLSGRSLIHWDERRYEARMDRILTDDSLRLASMFDCLRSREGDT